uniref:Ig-like domain-containing protein n=1 Tax=Poecilia reticulata TaxID=8081 RepID=A0A3P9QI05_POERE
YSCLKQDDFWYMVFVITSVMVEILFFLFLVIQTLNGAQANGGKTNISLTCVFRQNCTLPCNVDPSSDTIVHWDLITSGGLNVHSYFNGQDQLGWQDQQFKGRTSLFKDLISRGNASLMLTGVKIQDEGRYSCYSSTERGNRKTFIQLKVEGKLALFIKEIENRLICSSEGIYLKPELMWSVRPPSKLKLHSPTMVHQTEEQVYSISSSLLVFDSLYDLTYSCTVSGGRNTTTVSFLKISKYIFLNVSFIQLSVCNCFRLFCSSGGF